MNVSQLRDLLDGIDDDTEVRLMSQPAWPFEYSIIGTWQPEPLVDACDECGQPDEAHDSDSDHNMENPETFEPANTDPENVIYLVEGSQLGYGSKAAFNEYN